MKRSRSGQAASGSQHVGPLGFQQRIRFASTSQSPSASQRSALATLLVEQWSWGHLSCPAIQRIAAAAKLDFENQGSPVPSEIEKIASIGSSGLLANHMHRDLTKHRIADPVLKPALSDIALWIRQSFLRSEHVTQKILLPHELFAQLYTSRNACFSEAGWWRHSQCDFLLGLDGIYEAISISSGAAERRPQEFLHSDCPAWRRSYCDRGGPQLEQGVRRIFLVEPSGDWADCHD